MTLDLPQRKKLLVILREMFQSTPDLRTFLRDNTGRTLDRFTDGNLDNRFSLLIDEATGKEWLPELIEALKSAAGDEAKAELDTIFIRSGFGKPQVNALTAATGTAQADLTAAQVVALAQAARGERPQDLALRRALEDLGFLLKAPDTIALQKIVDSGNKFIDVSGWLARLTEIEGFVCRIVFDRPTGFKAQGTGFLIGPSVVMTNHHVIAPVLEGRVPAAHVRAQFDYHVLRDGSVDGGHLIPLAAANPIFDSAPPSAIDESTHPIETEPEEGALDYALLRLADPAGARPIDGAARNGPARPNRGWIDLEAMAPKAENGSGVYIVQHPSGMPLKLALDTEGVLGYSPNGRRLRYRTNTLNGSSGSPVFNQDWEILALHHAGDPQYPFLNRGAYNEGIPIAAIWKHLSDDVKAQIKA